MDINYFSHRKILGRGGGSIAAAAAIALLTAYCHLWSGETGVPLAASVRWATITLASWAAFAGLIWTQRDLLAARLDHAKLKDIAAAIGIVFAVATAVALVSTMVLRLATGEGLLLASIGQRLVRLAPMLMLVAVAVIAIVAALRWRSAACPKLAAEPTETVPPTAGWIEFPEAPLLRFRRHDVAVIRTARNYCELNVADRTVLVRVTAKSLEERLAPQGFARVHRGAIVNLAKVRMVEPDGSGRLRLLLDDGSRLGVSRAYSKELPKLIAASQMSQMAMATAH